MMKRNILAVVIPALLAAGAANAAEIYNKDGNKLDLYGKAVGLHYFSKDTYKEGNDGDKSYVRFGFKGETQINSELTGYGQWEYNVQANKAESQGTDGTKTRLGFAGLKFADYGSFDYGRNYGVVYDVESWTDMLPEFGGDTYTNTDNFMTGRANGVATYRNKNFFGLVDGWNFALQYQGKNESRKLKEQNGDGVGVSTTYAIMDTGISAGAAYSSSNRTVAQKEAGRNSTTMAGGNVADVWTVGVKYDANNVYLATMYAETRNMTAYGDADTIANKTQNYEVVAQYQFDFGLRPSIAYLQSKGKKLGTTYGNDKDLVKYVELGAVYSFNKNMSTYVDYKINLLNDNDSGFYKDNKIATDNIVATGLVYQF
ncbi:porin OmpC [Serratia aquatilis]|uniref:Porin OmpC n=1 Tax=Serratia aquatilis TaxID=1737515 RepID=A0ABV6EFX0_9GAMM